MNVNTIQDFDELSAISDAWQSWQWHPNADWHHYLNTLETQPGILRPYVITGGRERGLECLLVGRLEHCGVELRVGYASITTPKLKALVFVNGGTLGFPTTEISDHMIAVVLKALSDGVADFAFFNYLITDSPIYQSIKRAGGFFNRDRFPTVQVHRAMTLPDSGTQFWDGLSSKVRKNQRWQARRLMNEFAGDVAVRCFGPTCDVEVLSQDLETIACRTYQRGLGVGFVDGREMRKRFGLQAGKGWLRTFVLYLHGRPSAFWSGTAYRGVFYSDFMGYDARYAKFSPGMYLIMAAVEQLCECQGPDRDVSRIDFGLGDAQYKEILADQQWEESAVFLFGPTLRGCLLNTVRTPLIFIDQTAKKALNTTGLLASVKRRWRQQLRPGPTSPPLKPL